MIYICLITTKVYSQGFNFLYGTKSDDDFNAILLLSNGDYIVSGTTSSSDGFGGRDIYVSRINSEGETVWQNTYGGVRDETVTLPEIVQQ